MIAILALQGAFAEHQQMLRRLGVESFLVRNASDWRQHKDGLIIPGGESTAMLKIMRDEGLFDAMKAEIEAGLPVFGTCAGLIMLDGKHLGTMDITVRRNAYGRQLGSFVRNAPIMLDEETNMEMVFIRAPYIEKVGDGVEVLATVDSHIVAARQGNQLVTAFHPELTDNTILHEYFLRMTK